VHYSGATIGEGVAKPGMEQPLFYWDPSIAPSGLTVYDGALFPEWRGDIIVGALRAQLLVRVDMEDGAPTGAEERLFEDALGRIRAVVTGPDGALWVLTDDDPGAVWRIVPAE
jgi:glucose/arabinose dehydrogenase